MLDNPWKSCVYAVENIAKRHNFIDDAVSHSVFTGLPQVIHIRPQIIPKTQSTYAKANKAQAFFPQQPPFIKICNLTNYWPTIGRFLIFFAPFPPFSNYSVYHNCPITAPLH
jgi:hypothetical protein